MDSEEHIVRKNFTITDSSDGADVQNDMLKGTFPESFWESWVFLNCEDFESVPGDDRTNYGKFITESKDPN